jgi:acetyl-CoA acetyltransferase
MSHHRVAIVAGTRTPFVKAGKALASAEPSVLARHAVRGPVPRPCTLPAIPP